METILIVLLVVSRSAVEVGDTFVGVAKLETII